MIQLDYGVQLITRAEWGARPPKSTTSLSVDMDTNHWEGPTMGSFPHSSCASKVRGIQNFHMDSRGWTDIAYNAIACPHGYVFEGRGRGRRSAANGTNEGNASSYATCYLGGQGDPFTEPGQRAMKASGNWLTRAGSPRRCHRDWKSTECPGNEICAWVRAGQPVTWSDPPPFPPSVPKGVPTMHAIRSDARPWAVISDEGDVHMYGPATLVNVFLQPGDKHRPDEEYYAQAKARAFLTPGSPEWWPYPVLDREWDVCVAAARERRNIADARADEWTVRLTAIQSMLEELTAAPPP